MSDWESLKREMLEKANNGAITCSQCFEVADKIQVPLAEVGKAANDLEIKVRSCQLGCF